MVSKTREIGNASETKASSYLEDKGWVVLSRNFRQSFGEIDIICLDHGMLVAVEVKTIPDGWREEDIPCMVDHFKLAKIRRVLGFFIAKSKGLVYDGVRFDVIVVTHGGAIRHYEGVR